MIDFSSAEGKVAVVTGASRGIGEAIAKCYAENGMKVVCAARSEEKGNAVVKDIKDKGGDAIFIQTDCSSPEQIENMINQAVRHYEIGRASCRERVSSSV